MITNTTLENKTKEKKLLYGQILETFVEEKYNAIFVV